MKRFMGGWGLVGLLICAPAFGQGNTSSGMFGSRTIGGSIGPGRNSAFGGGAGMAGGVGSSQLELGNTGQITGSERFLRDNRTASQFVGSDNSDSSFVGSSTGGSGTGMGGLGGRSGGLGGSGLGGARGGLGGGMGSMGLGGLGGGIGGGLGGLGGLGGGFGNQGFGGMNNRASGNNRGQGGRNASSNRKVNVRTQLEVGFRYQPLAQQSVVTRLKDRLATQQIGRLGDIEVDVQDRVATLRGRVASQEDRDLARRLAKLEPGIESVQDELVVDELDATTGSPSDRP